MGFISLGFQIIRMFLKPFLKLIKFTGLYIPILYFVVVYAFFPKYAQAKANTPEDTISTIGLIATLIIAVCIFIRNIVRLITGNHNIKISSFILKLFCGKGIQSEGKFKMPKELQTGKGVVFGKQGSKYVSKPENVDGHSLIIGGAGSGKSSCVAIPTLLNWDGAVFAIDLKGELSETVKSFRPNMKVFDPTRADTIKYDPMKALKTGNRVQVSQAMAKAIIPIPPDIKDPFWIISAQNLVTSAILHFSKEDLDFTQIVRKVQGTNIDDLINILVNSNDEDSRLFANPLSGLKREVTSGIFTELSNNIITFATDSELQNALKFSSDSISPADLEDGKDIFIKIPEDKLDLWRNLLTVIVTQFLRSFERRQDKNDKPILVLLDEFARLGKIDGIMNALATLRSKNIHIVILTQSLAQLDVIYNRDNRKVITDNCSYKLILKATDAETQEYFSKLVGTHEVVKTSHSTQHDLIGINKGGGQSRSAQERKIIKPEEFAYLDKPVLFTPYGFFRPQKAPYYEDKVFISRQKQASEISA